MWKFYLYIMVMWTGSLPLLAAPDLTVMRDRDQTITGNKTFSGALVATNTVSLQGYVVDSFAASLLTATNSADVRSKVGLGGAALLNVGTTGGTVAAGNDSRIVNAAQQSGNNSFSGVNTFSDTVRGTYWTLTNSNFVGGGGYGTAYTIFGPSGSSVGGDQAAQLNVTYDNNFNYALVRMGAINGATGASAEFGVGGSGYVWSAGQSAFFINTKGTYPIRFIQDGTTSLEVDVSGNVSASRGNLIVGGVGKCVQFASGTKILSGSGSPESAVTAPVGSLYLRSDGGAGTTLYVKQSGSGNTGWVGK